MTRPEADWNLLNRYVDGDLDPIAASALERRLLAEPALAAELARVRHVKVSLSGLRPSAASTPVESRPQVRPSNTKRAWAYPVMSIAALAFGLAAWLAVPNTPGVSEWANASIEIHRQFSGHAYQLSGGQSTSVATQGLASRIQAFDLSSSKLRLVDVSQTETPELAAVAMHYRGRNGCRLTVVSIQREGSEADGAFASPGAEQMAAWRASDRRLIALASGMDANRFASIVDYLKAQSMKRPVDQLLIAMGDAHRNAAPCA